MRRVAVHSEEEEPDKTPRHQVSDEWHPSDRRGIKKLWLRNRTADAGRNGPCRTPREDQEEIQSEFVSTPTFFISLPLWLLLTDAAIQEC